jgi:hypothetical protein
MVRTGLLTAIEENDDESPASVTVHTQFSFVAKTASQSVESEVLATLDQLVFSQKGIGPSNGLALWACLWSLILIYRRLVKSYVAFQQFPCHVPAHYAGNANRAALSISMN